MNDAKITDLVWRSTPCADGACIEVARSGDSVLIRLKQDPDRTLVLSDPEWKAFLSGAIGGAFDDV
jgi:hypothetical protein